MINRIIRWFKYHIAELQLIGIFAVLFFSLYLIWLGILYLMGLNV